MITVNYVIKRANKIRILVFLLKANESISNKNQVVV